MNDSTFLLLPHGVTDECTGLRLGLGQVTSGRERGGLLRLEGESAGGVAL